MTFRKRDDDDVSEGRLSVIGTTPSIQPVYARASMTVINTYSYQCHLFGARCTLSQ